MMGYYSSICNIVKDDYLHSNEEMLIVLFATAVHCVGLWGFQMFFWILDKNRLFMIYKLPRDRPDMDENLPKNIKLNQRAIIEQIVGTLIVVPFAVYCFIPILKWRKMADICNTLPSWFTICRDFVIMLIGCDTLFYWVHRFLHFNGWIYRNIHKQHHEFKGTTIWASEYFGVIDMILNILPGVIPAIICSTHFGVLMLFTFVRQWQTVQSHAGYDLPYDPLNRGIFSGGARRHDFHHSHNHGCYGDWMPFWDWICGTDLKYKRYWDKKKEKKCE
jgi:sterol desaturase/sphingolipid hydroxylase (fatty acid hydroxylase superfamily)